ncbi:MAG TPA: hypothetical protein VKS21_11340 [Spirochaetota bacterium]|nr:hypothetical protein [Spirochaetota bacterium]
MIQSVEFLEFSNAVATGRFIRSNWPDHAEGAVLLTYVYTTYMNYYKTSVYDKEFISNYYTAESILEKIIATNETNQKAHFYLGVIYCYYGIYNLRNDNYFKAFFKGLKGIKYLEETINNKPVIIDSYFGLSQFLFYKYLFAKKFSWVAGAGEKEKVLAYKYLKRVKEQGKYMRFDAHLNELIMRQIDYDMSVDYYTDLKKLIRTHPGHIILERLKLDFLLYKKQYTNAVNQAENCLALARKNKHSGYPLMLQFTVKKAEAFDRMQLSRQCRTALLGLTNYEHREWYQNKPYEKIVQKLLHKHRPQTDDLK